MFKIIDNYLTKSYHQEIQELLAGSNFPWYYNNNISEGDKLPGTTHFNEYGFSHHFWKYNPEGGGFVDTHYATFIKPFLLQAMDTVGCNKILRCRADMVTWSPEEYIHPAHVDFIFPNTSTVYYVNDTDGDTILYGVDEKALKSKLEIKERISPKANRLIMYDGGLLHTGSSPTKHKTRILINSNFQI